jgi:hypothetical protein
MAKSQTGTALLTSQSLAAGASNHIRQRLDCTAVDGGIVTMRITNGGTGPTAQCLGRILVAHKQTSMPATAAEGTGDNDWKQICEFGGTLVANASTRYSWRFGPEVAYLEVEMGGNTSQAVTVEAHATTFTY